MPSRTRRAAPAPVGAYRWPPSALRQLTIAHARLALCIVAMDASCDSPTACTSSVRECLETPEAVVCAVCLSPVRRLDRSRCVAALAHAAHQAGQPSHERVADP